MPTYVFLTITHFPTPLCQQLLMRINPSSWSQPGPALLAERHALLDFVERELQEHQVRLLELSPTESRPPADVAKLERLNAYRERVVQLRAALV